MNQWPFVIAVYILGIGGSAGIITWCLLAQRRAEKRLEELKRK
ncbi:hypothetical protein [Alterisphingorhabdus coralli]|uniref:Heme exporter protein D n=1 Tax=Alterisphingorhabdus coralli TaxID=3071408 RepID=A0AA97F6S8_9SPHN|nr:hypothetical protein [Parasphingorhabdus sp. SCSIO 66989]WOE74317.1 hypothetical protein RB602_10700 [Parasphingorhabdus sp. SCSIO 66989]